MAQPRLERQRRETRSCHPTLDSRDVGTVTVETLKTVSDSVSNFGLVPWSKLEPVSNSFGKIGLIPLQNSQTCFEFCLENRLNPKDKTPKTVSNSVLKIGLIPRSKLKPVSNSASNIGLTPHFLYRVKQIRSFSLLRSFLCLLLDIRGGMGVIGGGGS